MRVNIRNYKLFKREEYYQIKSFESPNQVQLSSETK